MLMLFYASIHIPGSINIAPETQLVLVHMKERSVPNSDTVGGWLYNVETSVIHSPSPFH